MQSIQCRVLLKKDDAEKDDRQQQSPALGQPARVFRDARLNAPADIIIPGSAFWAFGVVSPVHGPACGEKWGLASGGDGEEKRRKTKNRLEEAGRCCC